MDDLLHREHVLLYGTNLWDNGIFYQKIFQHKTFGTIAVLFKKIKKNFTLPHYAGFLTLYALP